MCCFFFVVSAAPTPYYIGFNGRSFHNSLSAAWATYADWVSQYDYSGYKCGLGDWSFEYKGLNPYYNSAFWQVNPQSATCIHSTRPIIQLTCANGYGLTESPFSCACPAEKPVEIKGGCYAKCPSGFFLGKVSLQCKPICAAGSYLSTGGGCKPLLSCPANTSCAAADDADPETGKPDQCSGNPINTATGNKFQLEPDVLWGPGLEFVRYYNSQAVNADGMAVGWRHNFSHQIRIVYKQEYAAAPSDVDPDWDIPNFTGSAPQVERYVLVRPDGKSFNFSPAGASIDASSRNNYVFTVLPSGFLVQEGQVKETYDAQGRLSRLEKLGEYVILAQYYPDNGKLSQLTDTRGYRLDFGYERMGYLASVSVLNASPYANYTYDALGRLTKAARPPVVPYADPVTRQYHYEDATRSNLLTGITDENGVRYVTWSYDGAGRAITSTHAGSVDSVSLSFSDDAGGRYVDETDAFGSTRRFTFKRIGKGWYKQGNSQPGGVGCNASSSSITYDGNGNIASTVDFNGNQTSYTYDLTRNLEIRRIEAYGSPLQRTIETAWHSTFRLPVKITEPGRVTEITYDSRANITSRKISGVAASAPAPAPAPRVTSYSYDYGSDADKPRARKITVDGPRTDVQDITVYEFDEKANLISKTEKTSSTSSLVTLYGHYDGLGNPGSIIAPDGAVTKMSYNARGRLTRLVVGEGSSSPLTTNFEYDAVGLLKKVRLPDGSTVEYGYDSAQRLISIKDGAGNSIRYTLDNAGNRIKEEISDGNGVLAGLLQRIETAKQGVQPSVQWRLL